jgi:hypothetical protein
VLVFLLLSFASFTLAAPSLEEITAPEQIVRLGQAAAERVRQPAPPFVFRSIAE